MLGTNARLPDLGSGGGNIKGIESRGRSAEDFASPHVRYPQLYSTVGFAHHYRPLLRDELSFVLAQHWQKLGLKLDETGFTYAQAVASIARTTGRYFRLLRRLFLQIERVLRVNEITVIIDDVINTARNTLVIGVS